MVVEIQVAAAAVEVEVAVPAMTVWTLMEILLSLPNCAIYCSFTPDLLGVLLGCRNPIPEARLLMATAEFGEVGEKAASLCTEIAKSPYAPKLCRAWAFYYLGLAELKNVD